MQKQAKSFNDLNRVYPIGYSRNGGFVEEIMQGGNVLLVDARKSPNSKVPGFSKVELEKTYGERYRFAGHLLGNINYWKDNAPIEIANLTEGVKGLLYYLNKGHDLILLCGCTSLEKCHVRVILDALDQEIEVNVVKPSQLRSTLHICVRGNASSHILDHKEDDEITEWIKEQQEETAKRLTRPKKPSKTDIGAKVYAELSKGHKVPAVVLETAFFSEGNYLQCRLKIAQYNAMTQQWLASQYNRPVQSYKLTKRSEVIPELDNEL